MTYDVIYWRKMFHPAPKPAGFVAAILYGDEYWALVRYSGEKDAK